MCAIYLQVKDDLLNKLNTGHYEEGRIIPGEYELADMYGVSRPTVRKAVQLLVDEGYLEKRKKRGTIVCQRKIEQEFSHRITSFDREMARIGLTAHTVVVSFHKEVVKEEVAEALCLEEEDEVYKLIRLRYVDGQPNVLITTYVPAEMFPGLLEVDFSKERLYDIFCERGRTAGSIKRKLETIKADETIADVLNVQEGDPLFYVHSVAVDKNHEPIEYSIAKYRGDTNSFVFELTNETK